MSERPALAPDHPEDCAECAGGETVPHCYVAPPPAPRKAPSESAVSRFLGQKFEPSDRKGRGFASYGFVVQRGFGHAIRHVDWVSVEHEPGPWARSRYLEQPELLRKLIRRTLSAYCKHLEQRYDVTTNDDGSGEWDTLLVRKREERG